MKTILILEDNEDRIAAFQKAVALFGSEYELKLWRDAVSMCAECENHFSSAALISLDHDLVPLPGCNTDPGTGLDAAKTLAQCQPVCPVIIHTSNGDRAYSMYNELRFSNWVVERIGPMGSDWIQKLWAPKCRALLAGHSNTWAAKIPSDHETRMQRAMLSLNGLSVGDGFGECFFSSPSVIERRLEHRDPPPPPWFVTDDTMMALSIVRCLKRYGYIHQDALAAMFAREYVRDPRRGYGGTAHGILRSIDQGVDWKTAAGRVFDGQGSCGNGGAMRAAPIGAYFADDIAAVMGAAKASAEVTHAHPDGQTGAIAVALAAAWMVRESTHLPTDGHALIKFVLEHIPKTETRQCLEKALRLPLEIPAQTAVSVLGNGSGVIASDTVPFCLWCASKHPKDYVSAMWTTVSGLGDRDTTCAIVGGITALSAGLDSIPKDWLTAREPLPI